MEYNCLNSDSLFFIGLGFVFYVDNHILRTYLIFENKYVGKAIKTDFYLN